MADTLATPEALVMLVEADNAALAPDAGAAKVTVTPLTGLLAASRTVTCSGTANAVLIAVLCGVPAVALADAAPPTMFVSANEAGRETPATLAPTL